MTLVDTLLIVAARYAEATGLALATVGSRAANDGKFFARLAAGKDLTTGRYEAVMLWFSERWPPKCRWPAGIKRPERTIMAKDAA